MSIAALADRGAPRLQSPGMTLRLASLLLLATACSAPAPSASSTPSADAPRSAPAKTDWAEHMEAVDAHCSELTKLLLRSPQGDLKRAAAVANDAAATMRLGYGAFENKQVPGFARMARDSESWLLQIALEARQAHGDLAAELYRNGRRQHCNDCHDAHERATK